MAKQLGARGWTWQRALPNAGLILLIAAEAALIAPGHGLLGAIVAAVLLLLLINGALLIELRNGPPADTQAAQATRAVALVALVQVVGFGLPLGAASPSVGVLVAAVMIGPAVVWAGPSAGISSRRLLSSPARASQVRTAAAGLVLGFLLYATGAPRLWPSSATPGAILLALLATACAATVEELLYRGVLQNAFQRLEGQRGLLGAALLYAATYFDLAPLALVLTAGLTGLVFARAVARTNTLVGAIAGHVLLLWGAGGVWPVLLGSSVQGSLHGPIVTTVIALAVLAMTMTLASPSAAVDQLPGPGDTPVWRQGGRHTRKSPRD